MRQQKKFSWRAVVVVVVVVVVMIITLSLGRVLRMKDERVPRKAFIGYIDGRRPNGGSRRRWINAVDRDAKRMLKCKNWRKSVEDRGVWKRRIEEEKAQFRL
jgi:hypothetical protein